MVERKAENVIRKTMPMSFGEGSVNLLLRGLLRNRGARVQE
jgi:hypothetical protein